MSGNDLHTLQDMLASGRSQEEIARALLTMTLDAAPPEVADAVRICALPAWFDVELLAFLMEKEAGDVQPLIEAIAEFSFVMPRKDGGYVYHEATRERLLAWWRAPARRERFAALTGRLARRLLAIVRKYGPRLAGPDYLDALAVLDNVYPNLRAAWEHAVATEQPELLGKFGYAIGDYQTQRGLWQEQIACQQAALDAFEQLGQEEDVAATQNNLGNAYLNLPTGDRAANLQQAIACYEEALCFYTSEAAPLAYALTQNNLGLAYSNLPTGDRAANLQQAIACYQETLRFWTPEAAPLQYATTQNNLGNAYLNLPTGDRAANLQQAIACYEEALRFYTAEVAPLAYATTQNNLGTAYCNLPTGDRAANLQQAIACYEEALRFWTPEAAPLRYADTQNNLGTVYYEQGELTKAEQAYRRAVEADHKNGNRHLTLGAVLHRLNREEEAAQYLNRAREMLPDHEHYNHACLEAIAGNTVAALEQLEQALDWDATLRDWAGRDPDLTSLHGDPRFEALVRPQTSEVFKTSEV